MLYTVSWTSHGVELVELQLPPVITGLIEHATLAAFFPSHSSHLLPVLPRLTSQMNYSHLSPCLKVGFWENPS